MTAVELETRLSLVEANFKQLAALQIEIEQHDGDAADISRMQHIEDLYCEVKSKILSSLKENECVRSSPAVQSFHQVRSNSTMNTTRLSNLPKMQLPTFSGKYIEWTNWYNTFCTLVDSDPELDNLAKFIYLRSCLEAVPMRTIESLEVKSENYSHALDLLKQRFDNRAIIFQAHVKELFNIPRVTQPCPTSLRKIVDAVNSHLRSLKSLGSHEELMSVILFNLIRSKVDDETMEKWDSDFDCKNLPSWEQLSKFIANRCTSLENRELNFNKESKNFGFSLSRKGVSKHVPAEKKSALAATISPSLRKCPSCGEGHTLIDCSTFLKLTPLQRYFEIEKHSLCLVCLETIHSVKDCRLAPCEICKKSHHKLLHRENNKNLVRTSVAEESGKDASSLHTSLLSSCSINFLATAVLFVKNREGQLMTCRAILDSGSQLNFITSKMASTLGFTPDPTSIIINGIGDAKAEVTGEVITFIQSRVTNFYEQLRFLVIPEITQYSPKRNLNMESWQLPKNVELADPNFNNIKEVDMLLGVSVFFKLMCVGQISLGENYPVLQKSLLGWFLAGEYKPSSTDSLCLATTNITTENYTKKLSDLVEKFRLCENPSTPACKLSPEEQYYRQHFLASVKRSLSVRFMVRLPFKVNSSSLGESFSIALKRFLNLERKLDHNLELKKEYAEFINEYKSLEHLEIVEQSEVSKVKYFMPHHAVLRPESTSTKLRVVFDASCKSSNGQSLNDNLLIGPKLQPDLLEILIRFRLVKFVVTADVKKMYRQVLISPDDCNWQCILWRNNKSDNISVLRLKTVTYGTSAAPYLAVRCLNFLADNYQQQYPIGAKILRSSFYMDDMLAGADSVEELVEVKSQITEILNLGKFELHKWRSNIKETNIMEEPLQIKSEDQAKTLGVLWDSNNDIFCFSYNKQLSKNITKRSVLSELAQLFDPLGLLNPIIVLGKLFMQKLWLLRIDWDETLPQQLHQEWTCYREQLSLVSHLRFPRSVLSASNQRPLEIHGFSDASNKAYGCAIYVRSVDSTGTIVRLLAAKSRIAPLKTTSLPRLELNAALLLAQFIDRLKAVLPTSIDKYYFWSDSTIVLYWLASHPARWSTYVGNRTAQILELTKMGTWSKVDTKSNPADVVSRGMLPSELINCKLWCSGPEFLADSAETWPVFKIAECSQAEPCMEERKNFITMTITRKDPTEDLIGSCKFANDYLKLNHIFGYIFRWTSTWRAKRRFFGPLSLRELRGGLNYIIYNVQFTEFKDEMQLIANGKSASSSKLQKLNPFIDERGSTPLLRVGGRLGNADVLFSTKHPLILPGSHSFTLALVRFLHQINSHAGPQALVAFIRQRFWIINTRLVARKIVRACIACFRQRPKTASQLMGSLPAGRVTNSARAFEKVGIDFAGPIMIHYKIRGKKPSKAYLAFFICFATKACHIEVVSDLSAAAFVAALKRFWARRGLSSELFCDNATNFVGASRELKELAKQFWETSTNDYITEVCATLGVQFNFIPPRSPHFGGLWESAIKVAKKLLVHQIHGAALTFEELSTATTQVEAIMNSRPLCPQSSDPNDLDALTPGHFLIGRALNSYPEPLIEEELNVSHVNRWKRIQAVQTAFWKRWTREYLTQLQVRHKWKQTSQNIAVGTLVIVAEDNLHPTQWIMGRVLEVSPGTDGLVRVVSLKTKGGVIKRNIHKLCPLPLET